VTESLEDEVEAGLPEARRDIIFDCELLVRRGDEGVEHTIQEIVMQIGEPAVRDVWFVLLTPYASQSGPSRRQRHCRSP